MNSPLQKLRRLILPPRPDPARSRRIAEGRLMIGCLVAFGIFITIGVRIVGLADASASTRLAKSAAAITTERGRILDRKGRLLAGNLPITVPPPNVAAFLTARAVYWLAICQLPFFTPTLARLWMRAMRLPNWRPY